MPHITPEAVRVIGRTTQLLPVGFGHFVRYCIGSVILITAHHLKHAVGIVGDGIKANQLVRHRDRK
ncbi:hypothetical protein ACTK80_003993 [Yersinia enterocolitica]